MAKRDLWVFGYGSLMWNPDFPIVEQHLAKLDAFSRSFCMWSIHHRGTETEPGLVLALDVEEKASCTGVAFRVAECNAADTLKALRDRELISSAYYETMQPILLTNGQFVDAVCYVVDPEHVQYCGDLTLEQQAQVIARSEGGRGPNSEYLFNTAAHMVEIGIEDHDMMWLVGRVKALIDQ